MRIKLDGVAVIGALMCADDQDADEQVGCRRHGRAGVRVLRAGRVQVRSEERGRVNRTTH